MDLRAYLDLQFERLGLFHVARASIGHSEETKIICWVESLWTCLV